MSYIDYKCTDVNTVYVRNVHHFTHRHHMNTMITFQSINIKEPEKT